MSASISSMATPPICRFPMRSSISSSAARRSRTRPLVAINERHRVGGTALIIDLRKDFSRRAVNEYAAGRGMISAAMIKLTFNTMLK
ncbi:MAG: hypothetical protein WBE90_08600, partial [Xanthobacteraceae bacterium]